MIKEKRYVIFYKVDDADMWLDKIKNLGFPYHPIDKNSLVAIKCDLLAKDIYEALSLDASEKERVYVFRLYDLDLYFQNSDFDFWLRTSDKYKWLTRYSIFHLETTCLQITCNLPNISSLLCPTCMDQV